MPRLLRDFHCDSCGKDFEKFIDSTALVVTCDCGETANRVIGMPTVVLEGITGAFPGAHDRWARIREENAKQKFAKRRE
jgi:hypothetical protein